MHTILFDLDGTANTFNENVVNQINLELPSLEIRLEHVIDYNYSLCLHESATEAAEKHILSPGFFLGLDLVPACRDAYFILKSYGWHTRFCTTPLPDKTNNVQYKKSSSGWNSTSAKTR
jgi:hypothetical protein